MALVEYKQGGRRNCIFIPEDREGVGWRRMMEVLREVLPQQLQSTAVLPHSSGSMDALQKPSYLDITRGTVRLDSSPDMHGRDGGLVGVQSSGEDGRGRGGLDKEGMVRLLSDMQAQISTLQSNLEKVKRSVVEGDWRELGLGLDCSKGKGLSAYGPGYAQQALCVAQQAQPIKRQAVETAWRRQPPRAETPSSSGGPQHPPPTMDQGPPSEGVGLPSSPGVLETVAELRETGEKGAMEVDGGCRGAHSSELAQKVATEGFEVSLTLLQQFCPLGSEVSGAMVMDLISGPATMGATEVADAPATSGYAQIMSPTTVEGSGVAQVLPMLAEVEEEALKAVEVENDEPVGKTLEDGEVDEGCNTRNLWVEDMEGGIDGGTGSYSVVLKEADSMVQPTDQLMGSGFEGDKDELESPIPLRIISPKPVYNITDDWLLKKVEEVQECVGISFARYEDQFKALLIAMEARRPTVLKSAVKWDRELKHLKSSINYDNKEGSVGRERLKGKGTSSFNEA